MPSTPTLSVDLVHFAGESFVEIRLAGVESPNAPLFPIDHIIIIEPVTLSDTVEFTDGFHCRSNVDCAWGETITKALEAHIERARSANSSRSGYCAVVIDTILPMLECHREQIIAVAGRLLDDEA